MTQPSAPDKGWSLDIERQILAAIKQVRFGSVEILIHNAQIVQIERKEKIRFDKGPVRHQE